MSILAHIRNWVGIVAIVGALAALVQPLQAQVILKIASGRTPPVATTKANYYLDSVAQLAYIKKMEGWVVVQNHCLRLQSYQGLAMMQTLEGCSIGQRDGNIYMKAQKCICEDSLLLLIGLDRINVLKGGLEIVSLFREPDSYPALGVAQQLAAGRAYCLTDRFPYHGAQPVADMRTWGMLGTNGQWLIEPKFDAPFGFQNGFADVIYYGQKRRINEKGEFVE